MFTYLGSGYPHHQSPRNLLALRYDCHLAGFDRAEFVFVPKWGKLATHFLQNSSEFANQYHNAIFDHGGTLSQEALFSRFAWAVLKLSRPMTEGVGFFKFVDVPKDLYPDIEDEKGGGKGGGGMSRKRKREDEDNGEEEESSEHDEDAADQSGTYQPGGQSRKRADVLLQGPNAWLSDVLSQLDDGLSEVNARELEKDLGTAARRLPFFGVYELNLPAFVPLTLNLVDSNLQPTEHEEEDLPWYPGIGVVEKLKKKYIASHPNIRAHNLPKASNEFQSNSALYDS